ncbi:MAG TPA: amino acid adenylation domain-containing protein, partial [Herpetosiphonaceae bacterium]
YRVDRPLAAALKALASTSGVSRYNVLLSALNALLYRYTREPQISVGTYIAGRNRAEIENLIGFFINTLVMRTDLSGRPSFRELLGRVRDVALGAYEHQDLPFEKLLEELQPARDMSHTPFFQVMLVLQNTPDSSMELPDLQIEQFEPPAKAHAQFDLTIWLNEQDDQVLGSLEYNTDLFDESTVARMAEHLTNLLASIAADPDQRIDALSFLAGSERTRLLHEWHTTAADYSVEVGIATLVEQWAAQTPDAVAVTFEGRSLSYAALNRRANQLAHALQELGVGPETRVGIYLPRSLEMIVAVLAVLKAGGAYVPLDPNYPPDRVAFMVRDSGAPVMITQTAIRATLPAWDGAVLCLDSDSTRLASYPEQRPACAATGRSLAYVVYTSGSTDTPKGVMVEQRSLVNAFCAWRDGYDLRPGMRHLQMASFSFDVFAGDLVRALCSGGTLVICPRELLLEPPRLYELIRREAVTCGEFVPAVIRELMAYLRATEQRLDSMELVIVGSDLWYIDEYQQLRAVCGATTRVINSYGLSETTIDSTYFRGSALSLAPDKAVPIGRPFANTQMYILDQRLEPVPIGVIGEIAIGGDGLARGYQSQPQRTASQFVPHPWAEQPGARLYRTGDLARYLPDGNIEFLGRNDYQVKIRGFRIELGEIQTVLSQHPDVREALVIAHDDAQGTKRLVAYVVGEQRNKGTREQTENQEPRTKNLTEEHRTKNHEQKNTTVPPSPAATEAEARRGSGKGESTAVPGGEGLLTNQGEDLLSNLRSFLAQRLPEYMVPSAFVVLDALPLTPNGKLDRKALPVPDLSLRQLETASVPPRDAIELQLVEIWEDLLGVASIGVKDNFFELGGHSLLAVHLMARIQQRFSRQLPLAILFQSATIEHLAALLRSDTDVDSWSHLVPMQTSGSQPPLFCV